MRWSSRGVPGVFAIALWLSASAGLAQTIGEPTPGNAPGSNTPSQVNPNAPVQVTDAQGNTINITGNITPPTQTTTVYAPPPGGGEDPNSHLPSSSRPSTDISSASDSFDLAPNRVGGGTVYGNKDAPAILQRRGAGGGRISGAVPPVHTVKSGDTLWDLCATYYNNPWA